jgi:hypothetical protein
VQLRYRAHVEPDVLKDPVLRRARRCCLSAGVAIAGTCFIAVSVTPHVQHRGVRLTSGDGADSALGDGTALVMGGSGIPIPPQSYVNAADTLYLQPRDFTGTPQALDTPEGFYPTTGVNSLTADRGRSRRHPAQHRGPDPVA